MEVIKMRFKELMQYTYDSISSGKKLKNYFKDIITGAEFYFEVINNMLYIWVEPSNERQDWYTNLFAKSIKLNDGRCHYGYYLAATRFLNYLDKIGLYAYKDVLVTGYSMGGGITKVLAYLFPKQYISNPKFNIYAVSIEGAKVLNKRAAQNLKRNTTVKLFTIINNNDIVTKIPFNFVQSGQVIKIGKEKRRWYKGIKFRLALKEKGLLYKFFTVPGHEFADTKKNLKIFIDGILEGDNYEL